MNSGFTEQLNQLARPIWEAIHKHAVVKAIREGTFPKDKFQYWVQQDYSYAHAAQKFLGFLLARSPEDDISENLAGAITALGHELEKFRDYAQKHSFSIQAEASPTCRAYISFLLSTVQSSFEEGFTVLYGEEKAFLDVWSHIKAHSVPQNPYSEWINQWTSREFSAYVDWLSIRLDQLAGKWSAPQRLAARQAFVLAARYEFLFWEMTDRQERWPV